MATSDDFQVFEKFERYIIKHSIRQFENTVLNIDYFLNLLAEEVINNVEKEEVASQPSSFNQADKLIRILKAKPHQLPKIITCICRVLQCERGNIREGFWDT